MQETQVRSLRQEDPLEQGMATHSSILAWKISWTEEPGRLQSKGSQRVRHNWPTNTYTHTPHTLQSKVQRGTVIIVLLWNVLYFCTLLLYDFHPVSKTSVKEENHFGWLSCLFLFSTHVQIFQVHLQQGVWNQQHFAEALGITDWITEHTHPHTYMYTHTHARKTNLKFHSMHAITSPISVRKDLKDTLEILLQDRRRKTYFLSTSGVDTALQKPSDS